MSILGGKFGTIFLGRPGDGLSFGFQTGISHLIWDRRGVFLRTLRLVRVTQEEEVRICLNAFESLTSPVFSEMVSRIILCWNFVVLGKLYPGLTIYYSMVNI